MVVSLQQGGGSKDTWVLTTGPVSTFSMLRPTVGPVELSRGGNDLPSRAADNLFWLGRYVERAESLVRLLRGILVRLTENPGLAEVPELPYLLRALTNLFQSFPGFVGEGSEARLAHPEEELYAMVFDQERAGSLAYTLHSLYRVAGSVRDRISMDMWRVLSGLDLFDTRKNGNWTGAEVQELTTLSDLLDLLNRSVLTLAAFGGLAMESMTRGHGWRFLDMGRKIERCLHIVGLIRGTLVTVSANEAPILEALLEIADSSMTFRRRYLSTLQAAPVIDLLLADESNPRSLAYQLACMNDDVNHLPPTTRRTGRGPDQAPGPLPPYHHAIGRHRPPGGRQCQEHPAPSGGIAGPRGSRIACPLRQDHSQFPQPFANLAPPGRGSGRSGLSGTPIINPNRKIRNPKQKRKIKKKDKLDDVAWLVWILVF